MLRAAVVGCGQRGIEHARAIRGVSGLELAGLADLDPAALRQAAGSLESPGYPTTEALLERARPDVVVVATPPHARAALVARVAEQPGIRAIVAEKPMALSLAEADRMLAACAPRGILLTVCHQFRFAPEFSAMRAAIEAQEIGRLEFLRGVCYGNLLDQGSHVLDGLRWLTGGRRIQWVTTQAADAPEVLARHAPREQGYWTDPEHPVPMWMTHHIAFEGGIRAVMETGLLYQRSVPFHDDWLQRRITAIGSDGMAECRAAGYFKLLSGRRRGWLRQEVTIADNTATTRAFHEELRDALARGVLHRNDARDAVVTLEGLMACVQSAVDANIATLPLRRDRDPVAELAARRRSVPASSRSSSPDAAAGPPAPGDRAEPPRFSVVVPLVEHRGHDAEGIESWVDRQTYPRADYEVIAVGDGSEPALEARVRDRLGPQDLLLVHPGANQSQLYDLGARRARGQILFLTEAHCVGEPDCLEALARFFDASPGYAGACCRSSGVTSNALARMDQRLFEEGYREICREGNWRKVVVHGFAIRREVYLETGGLDPRFDRFAEQVLAARLRDRGHRLGYAAGAAVRHHYRPTLAELLPDIEGYTRGESAFRVASPEDRHVDPSFWPNQWIYHTRFDRNACRTILVTLFRDVASRALWRRERASVAAFLRALRQFLAPALLGSRWHLSLATLSLWLAMARCHLWRFEARRLEEAYRRVWDRGVRLARLRFVRDRAPRRSAGLAEPGRYRVTEIPEEDLTGFHCVEHRDGVSFRWSAPVAAIRLAVPPGSYEIRLDHGGLCPVIASRRPTVFFNACRVAVEALTNRNGWLEFHVDAAHFAPGAAQRLVLTCAPVRPWRHGVPDRRELGAPLVAVEVQPLTRIWRDPKG